MKKIVLFMSVLIVALAAFYFIPDKIEEVIVNELQEQGKRIFGTDVTVKGIEVDVKGRSATINEISIANPEKYTQAYAITLSSIAVKFDYESRVIEEIIISRPQVFAEFVDKSMNILDLANYAESVSRTSTAPSSGNETTSESEKTSDETNPQEEQIIFSINLVALEQASVSIQSNLTSERKQFSIERIQARNLRGNSQQLADQFVKKLFNDLSRQVIAESAKSLGEDSLEKLKDKAREKLKELLN